MKKLLLSIALLIFGLTVMAQTIDTTGMSDYEKYYYAKEAQLLGKSITPDTVFVYDTVYVKEQKPENDDVYYIPSREDLDRKKEELKLKKKEIRLEQKELRLYQDSLYYDAKKEVYNDLYYSSLIYRFHSPTFYPYWRFNYYYNPFYYDPFYFYDRGWNSWYWDYWYWDSWYYRPYRYYYWYPYWGYNNYRSHDKYYINNYYYYGYNGLNSNFRYSSINMNNRSNSLLNTNINYSIGRRTSSSTLAGKQPVVVNRTVQVDKSSGKVVGINEGGRRIAISPENKVH